MKKNKILKYDQYKQVKVGEVLNVKYRVGKWYSAKTTAIFPAGATRVKALVVQKTEHLLILKSVKTGRFFSLGLYELLDEKSNIRTTVETA